MSGMEHNGLDITITHIMIGIGSFFTVAVGRRMMTMMIMIMITMSFIMMSDTVIACFMDNIYFLCSHGTYFI